MFVLLKRLSEGRVMASAVSVCTCLRQSHLVLFVYLDVIMFCRPAVTFSHQPTNQLSLGQEFFPMQTQMVREGILMLSYYSVSQRTVYRAPYLLAFHLTMYSGTSIYTCNKGPRDWQNLFTVMRFCYIKVLFHIFYCYWGKENSLLYQGLCYSIFKI